MSRFNYFASKLRFITTIGLLCLSFSCKKTPKDPEFYLKCKINGRDFISGNCANCLKSDFVGDSLYGLGGGDGNGNEFVSVGQFRKLGIKIGSYNISPADSTHAFYRNQPYESNYYRTDSNIGGVFVINELDTIHRIISGAFSFQAFRKRDSGIVRITEGSFRTKYTKY